MRIIPAIVAVGLAQASAPPAAAQVLYSVNDLGSLFPGGTSKATGINASGQTTGFSFDPSSNNTRAFRVAPGGKVTDPGADLGTLGGRSSDGSAINDLGQVTGDSDLAGSLSYHAFRTSPTGSINSAADLGVIGSFSSGKGINNLGQVVGWNVPGTQRAFRTVPNGLIDTSTDLGVFPGADGKSVALAINASGQTTGSYFDLVGGGEHAYRTTATGTLATAENLGDFGGPSESSGNAINSIGQVVGFASTTAGTVFHAFRSSPSGQPLVLQDLGTLGSDTDSSATAINSLGVVLGTSVTYDSNGAVLDQAPFIYDTQMRNLNDLVPAGWTIIDANAINDAGQIAGDGSFDGGPEHALVLTPVPEPGSLASLCAAAGGWALWRRRKAAVRP